MIRTVDYTYEDKLGIHELAVEWVLSPSRSSTMEDPMDYGEIEIISIKESGVDFVVNKGEYLKIERYIDDSFEEDLSNGDY